MCRGLKVPTLQSLVASTGNQPPHLGAQQKSPLWFSSDLENCESFRSSVPETRTKTKYILIIYHNIIPARFQKGFNKAYEEVDK